MIHSSMCIYPIRTDLPAHAAYILLPHTGYGVRSDHHLVAQQGPSRSTSLEPSQIATRNNPSLRKERDRSDSNRPKLWDSYVAINRVPWSEGFPKAGDLALANRNACGPNGGFIGHVFGVWPGVSCHRCPNWYRRAAPRPRAATARHSCSGIRWISDPRCAASPTGGGASRTPIRG